MSKRIYIDGSNFSNLEEFYDEIEKELTFNLTWKPKHNLDAFNDLLRGGFGITEYKEPVTIVWNNHTKSIQDLSYNETIRFYERIINECHPSNVSYYSELMNNAKEGKGQTIFYKIIGIIKEHDHIDLVLN